MNRTGLSRSTIYAKAKAGAFPKAVNMGPALAAWVEAEVEQWILDRISCRDSIADQAPR
jgi:prophage regulatory protein